MLIVKLMKYEKTYKPNTDTHKLSCVNAIAIHTAAVVYLDYEKDGRQVLRFNEESVTIGTQRIDTMYDKAYIMNEAGKTVDTIS